MLETRRREMMRNIQRYDSFAKKQRTLNASSASKSFLLAFYPRLPTPSAVAHMYALYVSFMAGKVAMYSRSTIFLI